MRIVFITQDDSFYIGRLFRALLEQCGDEFDIRRAVICRTMGKSTRKLAAELLDFYGPVDFVRMGARYATNRALAMLVGSWNSRWPISLSQLFLAHGVPTLHCQNVNARATVEAIGREEPDLIVSVAAPQVFKRRLLEVPRVACINIHTARLPQYRGMMPNFWVLYHGDQRSAITVHTMDKEIDKGATVLQREFDILPDESLDQLIKRTKTMGASCLLAAMRKIKQHGIVALDPPDIEPSYFSFPSREHVTQLRSTGRRLL
jgi:methionyl-tRNA formyltransferase